MNNIKEMIIAIRNGDYDHISEVKRNKAWYELQILLGCGEYELTEFIKQFVYIDTKLVFTEAPDE